MTLFLIDIIKNLLASFNNNKDGYSGRKLSWFVGVITAVYITIFNVKSDNAIQFLYSWQVFVLLFSGIVTTEQVIKLFLDKKNPPTDENTRPTNS